jgi:NTE family protein
MTSIGLVLGAGGVIGAAYDIGAIAAIAECTGWDARSADLLVGTSAGSGVAASLRIGLSPPDLYLRAQDQPISAEAALLLGDLPHDRVRVPEHPGFDPLAFLRPTAPWLVVPTFLAPGPVRPGLLAGLFPRGRVDTGFMGDRVRALATSRWPDRPTWVVATRIRDGKRVVLGRDDVDVADLGTAVEASSAVPGYFAPVTIDGREYFDGGTYSPTNADLTAGLGFDLVVVISPMSAVRDALGRVPVLNPRVVASRTVAREVAAIRERGTPVLVIQPTATDLEVMRGDALEHTRSVPVARRAFESATARLADPAVADRIAVLRRAASETAPGTT